MTSPPCRVQGYGGMIAQPRGLVNRAIAQVGHMGGDAAYAWPEEQKHDVLS